MASNSKRKGCISQTTNITAKRARWENEVAMSPSECSPTAAGAALISGVQTAHILGGSYTVAGRDNIIHNHNYVYGPQTVPVDILEIMQSLPLPNFRAIQLDTLSKATDGTCIWLTSGEMFLFWISNGRIIWGIGIPGAGKTVLSSIVIRHLGQLEESSGGVICFAFVYLRYSEPLSIRDILESLVKQIVERHSDLVSVVAEVYRKHKKDKTKPTQQELISMLEEFVKCGKSLFFVLDALDEMRVEDRSVLLRLLTSMDAKLFVTSRPLEVLQKHYPQARVFLIAASRADLDLHIHDFLQHSPEVMELLEGTTLEQRIVEAIHHKSAGMFLHARLQLEALRNCVSVLDVEETLEAFPPDIQAIYMKTWERICNQGPKLASLAKLVLLWVTHAHKEMTIVTLRRAVATSPDTYVFEAKRMVPESLLLSVCCGLVSVDEKTRLVRLIHYTARDAITPLILKTYPVPHAILARVCISHLTTCGIQNYRTEADCWDQSDTFDALLAADDLLAYASLSWARHTHRCCGHPPVFEAIADLVLNSTNFPLMDHPFFEFGGPLHVAAFYGLENLILPAARLQFPNARTEVYTRSPLYLALENGHLECAKTLLSIPGIDVNVPGGLFRNPLTFAAACGRIESVQLLLEASGIEINAADTAGRTALMFAARNGQIQAAKLLLSRPGVDVNTKDELGWTPLMHAVQGGYIEVVKQLLNAQEIDVNVPSTKVFPFWHDSDDIGWTALMMASYQGDVDAVKALLAAPGIDVNILSHPSGQSALSYASAKGHTEIVELLIPFSGITSHNV